MVDSGQVIRPVGFSSPVHAALPVEVVTLGRLIDRVGPEFLVRPDRPSFDIAMLVHSGTGTHTIDFEPIDLVPGRLLWTRPGQVQSWDPHSRVEATLVFSRTGGTAEVFERSSSCDLGPDSLATAKGLIDTVSREQNRYRGDTPSARLMASVFSALEALFERAQTTESTRTLPEPYIAFRTAIETGLGASHNARDYALNIGFSERTISRACQRVTGLTAKGVLNQRLLLEAKRLLAHTDLPASAIGAQLGFSEATNFGKFFLRHTAERPAEFRSNSRTAR